MRFTLCNHRATYIERRLLIGTELAVLHFVCHDCGKAWPMMRRTIEEHVQVVERGAAKPLTVTKESRK